MGDWTKLLACGPVARNLAHAAPAVVVGLGETSRALAREQGALRPRAYQNIVEAVVGPAMIGAVKRGYRLAWVRNAHPVHVQLLGETDAGISLPALRDRLIRERLCFEVVFALNMRPPPPDREGAEIDMVRLFAPGDDEVEGVSFGVCLADGYDGASIRLDDAGGRLWNTDRAAPRQAAGARPGAEEGWVRARTLRGLSIAVERQLGARAAWLPDFRVLVDGPGRPPVMQRVALHAMYRTMEERPEAREGVGLADVIRVAEDIGARFGNPGAATYEETHGAMVEAIGALMPLAPGAVLWYPTLEAAAGLVYGPRPSCVVDVVVAREWHDDEREGLFMQRAIPFPMGGGA